MEGEPIQINRRTMFFVTLGLVGAFLAMCFVTVSTLAVLRGLSQLDQPAFTFQQHTIIPRVSPLCVGDPLEYTLTVRIDRAAIVDITHSLLDLDRRRFVREHNLMLPVLRRHWVSEDTGVWTDQFLLPLPELPPGHYELRGSRDERDRAERAQIFRVPFEIVDCGPGRGP